MLSRIKIIRALLETGKLALFDYHNNNPEQAAEVDDQCSKNAIKAHLPDGRAGNGNGVMRSLRNRFYKRYAKRMNELTSDHE